MIQSWWLIKTIIESNFSGNCRCLLSFFFIPLAQAFFFLFPGKGEGEGEGGGKGCVLSWGLEGKGRETAAGV